MQLTIILGTAREGRQSEKVANYLRRKLEARKDLQIEFVDVKDFSHGRTIPPWEKNDATKNWRAIVKKTDGFLIVFPEYNHSFPGELKMLLDQDFENYAGKPVAFASVSSGGFGGVRAVESLVPVARYIGLVPLTAELNFSKVAELFAQGEAELDTKYAEKIEKLADALVQFAARK
ncbi:MAG: NAD(P)H-dependent oxidoreductase [Patescibacteria group bacterium]